MVESSRRIFLGGTAAALVSGYSSSGVGAAAVPSRSGLPWASGAFGEADAVATLRGRPLDVLTTFSPKSTWTAIRNTGSSLAYLLDPVRGNRQEAIVISYPMFPVDGDSPKTGGARVWQAAADGAYDSHHDAASASLARYSQQLIIRIGWEWNGRSYPWSCVDVALAPNYKRYFARIVNRFRDHNPSCLIDWCSIKAGKTNASIDQWYPGDAYVDFIGNDKYDFWPALRTQADWDKDYAATYMGGPKGAGAWLTYAKSRGKKLSFSEWAVVSGPDYGGGDNGFFVQKMLAFFKANATDIGYESYFNTNNIKLGWNHLLQDNPNAAAAYRSSLA